jgi:hypothetical protein
VNPAAGVLAPAPGRLEAPRFRRPEAAERIRFFLAGRGAVLPRSGFDVVLPLALLSLISVAGTLAAPALRHNPLLLMALSPRLPFLVLAAPRVGFVSFLIVGTVRLCLADPFHFRLGRRLASSGASGCCLRSRLVGHRLARPASAVAVLLRPNGRHLALAGAVRLRTTVVVALDLVGTVVYLAGLHGATALFH